MTSTEKKLISSHFGDITQCIIFVSRRFGTRASKWSKRKSLITSTHKIKPTRCSQTSAKKYNLIRWVISQKPEQTKKITFFYPYLPEKVSAPTNMDRFNFHTTLLPKFNWLVWECAYWHNNKSIRLCYMIRPVLLTGLPNAECLSLF
jgi:hypothetical protein